MNNENIKHFSAAYLHSRLDYNPVTGQFLWASFDYPQVAARMVGKPAGCLDNTYIKIRIDNVLLYAHAIAWKMTYGEGPDHQIDHINRIRTDNRIVNLRDVQSKQNAVNKSVLKCNTSGVPGVSWDPEREKWQVYISLGGRKTLGRFDSFDEAVAVRKKAEQKLFGDYGPK